MISTNRTRFSYTNNEILEDEYFADIVSRSEDGTLSVDYARFHTTGPLEEMLALSTKGKEETVPTIAGS